MYEPVLISEPDGNVSYQAGVFPTQAEAEKVLAIWRSEGRTEEMAVNFVQVYDTADEWFADR